MLTYPISDNDTLSAIIYSNNFLISEIQDLQFVPALNQYAHKSIGSESQ
jgi:hypothetical protein